MYLNRRQSNSSLQSSTPSATIALIVCLVLIGVSAVLGVTLFYYRFRRNNPTQQTPVSVDSSMPTMKITFLSPPSSTSSPIRMELVPASTRPSHETESQSIPSGHSRLGTSGGIGGMCCGMSTDDHRARSILSESTSFEEGISDWNQIRMYEPFSPILSPDNRRFSSIEPSSVKGTSISPSALGLDVGPNLSRTMSLSSGSFYARYPSQQMEDSTRYFHRHTAQPGFVRSVSFGAYGEPLARPQLSSNHSHSYTHQSYGTPSFYRFTSAPPETSPVSSEISPVDFLPPAPSISYHRPMVPKHQRSTSLPENSPFTSPSSPSMKTTSHFKRSPSSPISPLPPTLQRANSNSIPPLIRQTKAMEFESARSEVSVEGYFDNHYHVPTENSFRNGLPEESLVQSRVPSIADQGLGPAWIHGGMNSHRDYSLERGENSIFLDRGERLPPEYEQSEGSFRESVMV